MTAAEKWTLLNIALFVLIMAIGKWKSKFPKVLTTDFRAWFRPNGPTVIDLPDKWAPRLQRQPETDGPQVAAVLLKDGRRFENVTIFAGVITNVHGYTRIPFSEGEIEDIVVAHKT